MLNHHHRRSHGRRLLAAAAVALTAVALAGCSPSGGSTAVGSNTAADKYGTKDHPITLTFWGWGSEKDLPMIAAYHKLHPYVTVQTSELGSTTALYTKLATIFKSGTGAPDLTALELPMMPTFAQYLQPLQGYDVKLGEFDPSAINAATYDKNVYAVPTDYGPMVMYYRTDVFAKYGLTVPTTWDAYLADAKKLHSEDPSKYITYADPGDPTPALGLIWQASGKPFTVKGDDITINLSDAGSQKYADLWSTMLQQKLVDPTPGFTTDWFNQLGGGDYATWFAGAWGTSVLQSSLPKSAGKWKVTTLPSWTAGAPADGAMGGSGTAVTKSSPHKAAAAAFADWYGSTWPLTNVGKAGGATFPASLTVQKTPAYADATSEILGGQVAVPVYLKASSEVVKGWQFLPYQLYAGTIFKDTAGQQIASGYNLKAGLQAWQKALIAYGTQQGYTVHAG